MNPHVRRWLEKTQVQIAAVGVAVVAWFAVWRLVAPANGHDPLVFFPLGDWPRLAVFAAMVWAMAGLCALITLSARAEGALLAALVGVAALGLHGGPVRTLLWRQSTPSGVFRLLAGELLVLCGVLVGALVVIHLVRALARRLLPRWVWPGTYGSQQVLAGQPPGRDGGAGEQQRSIYPAPYSVPDKSARAAQRQEEAPRPPLLQALGYLAMEMALATILLVLTFRSTEPGQIAFALAGSFFVASLIAHLAFPIRSAIPCWLGPIIMGAAVLALGGLADFSGPGPVWRQAILVAERIPLRAALPVHWLSLGCGGAVAGFWVSCRAREAPQEQSDQRAKAG